MERKRIGVWGHYHGGNLGDDIVVATLIANIRRRLPYHEVYGISLNPEDTASRHGGNVADPVRFLRFFVIERSVLRL